MSARSPEPCGAGGFCSIQSLCVKPNGALAGQIDRPLVAQHGAGDGRAWATRAPLALSHTAAWEIRSGFIPCQSGYDLSSSPFFCAVLAPVAENCHAEPVSISHLYWRSGRLTTAPCSCWRPGRPEAREITVRSRPTSSPNSPEPKREFGRSQTTSELISADLTEHGPPGQKFRPSPDRAFPRHGGRRARRGQEHPLRLCRDLADFAAELARRDAHRANLNYRRPTDDLRAHSQLPEQSAAFAAAWWHGGSPPSASSTASSMRKGRRGDDPSAVDRRSEARPQSAKVLSIAEVDRLLATARSAIDQAGAAEAGAAARRAASPA